ncbi:RNA-directed DNA polymerase, eukaryota, reverse transcriptase zinc-binding domain protein [Tanacetum coccineum]
MNMSLVLMTKVFKLNYSTPTNNNHKISSNPHNRQIAQPGMNMGQDRLMQMVGGNGGNQFSQYAGQNVRNQNGYNAVQNVGNQVVHNASQNPGVQNVRNQNGLIVVSGIANQNPNGKGNVVAAQAKVKPRRRDAAYLQTQLLIAQKEEAGIKLQAKEFDLMAATADLNEIEEVNVNFILMANLQQASTSGTQTDKALVYDSDRSTKREQYTELLEPIPEPHQVQQNDSNVISEVSTGLVSSRTSIIINGSPTSEFYLKRGLRQEDPLSLFLFIIVMNGLHMALNDGLAANMFHGVKVGSPGMHLSHLFYADDVIILSEWNLNAMENIIRVLNIFYIASGLKTNIHKSNVYGVEVSSNEVEIMASYTGCEAGFFPFTYLGLPIGSNMSRITNWKPLIDRFKARLSGWKANLLSIGGRLLIESVLGSLGNYYLSIFKVPEMVVKSLKSLCASFFWGSSEDSKKLAWVKWSNILASLDKGGLGVGSLKAFNMSLLLKWRWRIFHISNALWVHVVKAIHGDEAGIDIRGCHTNGVWASIVGSIFHLHSSGIVPLNSICSKVGDGSSIHFWKDTWLGDDPLYIRYNRLYHLEKNKDCFIQQHIAKGSWFWDWSRPVNVERTKAEFDALISDIARLEPEELVDSDTCIWILSHDDKFSVNSIRKHIDELSLPSLSPSICHGTLQRKRRTALTPSLLLPVGPYGGLEIISLSTLIL